MYVQDPVLAGATADEVGIFFLIPLATLAVRAAIPLGRLATQIKKTRKTAEKQIKELKKQQASAPTAQRLAIGKEIATIQAQTKAKVDALSAAKAQATAAKKAGPVKASGLVVVGNIYERW